jgi:diaminopimelate epimerase
MSVLANHPFTKMNGLGNEIVVVDMRRQAGTISAQPPRPTACPTIN